MASTSIKNTNNRSSGFGTFMGQWSIFLRQFLKHPSMIGSVIPSSAALVDAVLDEVDWANTRLFVEYGPGMGTFTKTILERMRPDATLLAIDLNPDFVAWISENIEDTRLKVIHGSAADVLKYVHEAGFQQADYILSGIPFSTLPDGVGEAIGVATRSALRVGGSFLVYQYSMRVHALLTANFEQVTTSLEWRNFPPCRSFVATKGDVLAKAA